MTKSEFLETKKLIETKIKRGTFVYVTVAFIITALFSFALSNDLVPENQKFWTVIIMVVVIPQILVFRRICHLTKNINLFCNSCNLHLNAKKLTNVLNKMLRMKKILIISVFVMIQFPIKASEENELKQLIMSLNSHVVDLEKRVKALQNLVNVNNVNVNVSNSKVAWRKLKRGMTNAQVRNLLGEPLDIDVYTMYSTNWYYTKSSYNSKLTFFFGKLESWKEPKS